ncbi:MAG: hypothetical protein KF726_02445, partial [Anaerolineae bacterium]|nr:hypothetical protein [Anaerolineae bacterium]
MFRFDDSDPQFVIIYTGDKHALPDDYRQSFKFWAEQLKRRERFGVIMVDEPHEHPEGESDEDHRQHEAEFARVINDFRRDYRESTSQQNVGYARVMPLAWNDLYFSEAGSWDRYV